MRHSFQFYILFIILLVSGCSGGGGSGDPFNQGAITGERNTTAIETCYDVKLTVAGASQTKNVCATSENGNFNGLGAVRFLKFTAASATTASITATRTSGLNPADPDIYIYQQGSIIATAETTRFNSELLTKSIAAGDYVVEINEFAYSVETLKVRQNNLAQQKTASTAQVQATSPSSCTTGNDSTVSGIITFDRVNHFGSRLDYNNITQEPVQQALVEVICNGGAYSSMSSNADGSYSLSFPNNQSSFIRVNAQMLNGNVWDISVVSNTLSGSPIYVMDGQSFIEVTNQVRNLNADSGWGGNNYSSSRVAAPFAILDSVRKAKDKVLSVANLNFPPLKINWSPANSEATISGSFFDGTDIFLLGAEDSDTDEYDEHVIIHEWGHYFDHNFSRSDSIGGIHFIGDILDIRLAFGEGFGNAFSAMVTDDQFYVDTSGFQQGNGFTIDMDNNNCQNSGWFSECSVHSVLYDIYDANNDGSDTLSMGFAPIYNVLINAQKNTTALTSIFSFIKPLKDQNAGSASLIDNILSAQRIDPVMDIYGSSQITANPGFTNQLPIYQSY
jgi:hypothetical protein